LTRAVRRLLGSRGARPRAWNTGRHASKQNSRQQSSSRCPPLPLHRLLPFRYAPTVPTPVLAARKRGSRRVAPLDTPA
jgi:hypothetical protein